MSDSDDLFGSSSDGENTDDLLAASNKKDTKPIAKKKSTATSSKKKNKPTLSRLKKKKDAIPDADNDSDNDEADGLFDSDGDEDKAKKPKASTKTLSKKEKMEALKKKARAAAGLGDAAEVAKAKMEQRKKERAASAANKDDKGYDSQNSYDSGTGYNRTKEDDDFIDVEGEDEDVVREYYAEQHFDDERPDGEDDEPLKKGKVNKSSLKKRGRGPDSLTAEDEKDKDNPMMAAVNRMKKKKKVARGFEELKTIAEEFVAKMEYAADEDDIAIKEKRPGMKKLQMLSETVHMMTNREMVRPLLESDILNVVVRWIRPLPDGSLGNITVRQKND